MSGFVFHPEAISDLEEIWEFIANDNLDAADRVVKEFVEPLNCWHLIRTQDTSVPTWRRRRFASIRFADF